MEFLQFPFVPASDHADGFPFDVPGSRDEVLAFAALETCLACHDPLIDDQPSGFGRNGRPVVELARLEPLIRSRFERELGRGHVKGGALAPAAPALRAPAAPTIRAPATREPAQGARTERAERTERSSRRGERGDARAEGPERAIRFEPVERARLERGERPRPAEAPAGLAAATTTPERPEPARPESARPAPARPEPARRPERRQPIRSVEPRPDEQPAASSPSSPRVASPRVASPRVASEPARPRARFEPPVDAPRPAAPVAPFAPAAAPPAPPLARVLVAAAVPAATTASSSSEGPSGDAAGFAGLGLSETILRGVLDAGYQSPTPIQARAIGPALEGKNIVGQARTGTGKTAAFGLPLLHRIVPGQGTQALVLAPTRELAIQVREAIETLARHTSARVGLCYGGVGFDQQRRALSDGVEIIVGTPGRVLDLYRQGAFALGQIRMVVLDECDRMFDLGFRPDIIRVLKATEPSRQQLLLFSATVSEEVLSIARRFMTDPVVIYTAPERLTVDGVDQFYVAVSARRKEALLAELIRREVQKGALQQAIVFTRTKRGCDALARRLNDHGVRAHAIHGDLRQSQREAVLGDLRAKRARLLVATDVAARGLDIDGISHVFNYDIPEYPEDYVHRVGRTARMGARGAAFTLVCPEQGEFLTQIEKLANVMIQEIHVEGFDAGVSETPPPPKTRGTGAILFSSAHA